MKHKVLLNLQSTFRETLLDNIIPFWLEHGWDKEYGGITTCLDRDGSVLDTDKNVWQQGRFAWMLGYLYNTCQQNPLWLKAMESTCDFMRKFCFDQNGEMFFQVTREGFPIRKRRYCFAESFAATAFGEHARATGNGHSKKLARQLYRTICEHVPSPPKFYATRPLKSLAPTMIQLNTVQRLRESIAFESADDEADRLIAEIARDFVKDDLKCCLENTGINGEASLEHFDGRILNPGHAIEASWFIMYEGKYRHRTDYIRLGCSILDYMFERGWDKKYGGMLYYVDLEGKPVAEYWHDMKFWWNHNETLIAILLAWQLTRNEKYAKQYQLVHDYTYSLFPDRSGREWFGYFHRDGRQSSTLKGNHFKGCFHIPRQQWECQKIVNELLATPCDEERG